MGENWSLEGGIIYCLIPGTVISRSLSYDFLFSQHPLKFHYNLQNNFVLSLFFFLFPFKIPVS